jgi:hypothetical protein
MRNCGNDFFRPYNSKDTSFFVGSSASQPWQRNRQTRRHETNDLPLELSCAQIATVVVVIVSQPIAPLGEYTLHTNNETLYDISSAGAEFSPTARGQDTCRASRTRAVMSKVAIWRMQNKIRVMSLGRGVRRVSV